MEWVLQVVDEIDDAVWAVRHGLEGASSGVRGVLRAPALVAALALLLPGCGGGRDPLDPGATQLSSAGRLDFAAVNGSHGHRVTRSVEAAGPLRVRILD
jgi:hypothetical protein